MHAGVQNLGVQSVDGCATEKTEVNQGKRSTISDERISDFSVKARLGTVKCSTQNLNPEMV